MNNIQIVARLQYFCYLKMSAIGLLEMKPKIGRTKEQNRN